MISFFLFGFVVVLRDERFGGGVVSGGFCCFVFS